MTNKNTKKIVLLVLVILVAWYYSFHPFRSRPGRNIPETRDSVINLNHRLVYTRHAICRMECRHISEKDIQDVILQNHINRNKSDGNDKPCPTEAFEGKSNAGHELRIIIASCESVEKVVTVIDLDEDFKCDCK